MRRELLVANIHDLGRELQGFQPPDDPSQWRHALSGLFMDMSVVMDQIYGELAARGDTSEADAAIEHAGGVR